MTVSECRRRRTGASRKEQAAATRARILDAALALLNERGYLATTMSAIAERAGVAVQTVYFIFHTKIELLQAVLERSAAGVPDAPPVMQRPWMVEALEAPDGRRAIALMVEHGVDIYLRSAMLARAVRQVALTEPDVRDVWIAIVAGRKAGMGRLVASLREKGQLEDGLSVERATDICHAIHSHEMYLELVVASRWSVPAYKAWLYETLCRLLLDRAIAPADDDAFADLSFAAEAAGA